MKTLRGLYIMSTYILALPFMVIWTIIGAIAFVYIDLRDYKHIKLTDLFEGAMAAIEGFKLGHKQNMLFVKYGKNI